MMTPEPDKKQGKAIDDYYDARKTEPCKCLGDSCIFDEGFLFKRRESK